MPTVLIIDDEAALLQNLARFLLSFSGESRVLTAATGEDGLRQLAAEPGLDVLVTDVCLPGIDGLEVVRRAKLDRPELPVVVMTAYGSDSVRRIALANGACWFVDKPVDLDEFRASVLAAAASVSRDLAELSGLDFSALVQTRATERDTVVLCYRSGVLGGYLVLVDGCLMSCATESHEGLAALDAMLAWSAGRVRSVRSWGLSMYPRNVDVAADALVAYLEDGPGP